MIKKYYGGCILVILTSCLSYSQITDTIFPLKEVITSFEREKYFSDDRKVFFTERFQLEKKKFSTVAEIIDWTTPIDLRQYGSLGSATNAYIRGNSTHQVQINWNGFPVNSLTLGTVDLSTLSSGASDEISIHWGSSSSLFGSGMSSISIKNTAGWNTKNELELYTEFGSFGNQKYGIDMKVGNTNIRYKLNTFFHNSDGDFAYSNLKGEDKRREHNSLYNRSLSQFLFFRLSKNHFIDVGFSYLNKDIEIPNTLLSDLPSQQQQQDKTVRVFVKWENLLKKSKVFVKTAYFFTDQTYEDVTYEYSSRTKTKVFFSDITYRRYLSSEITVDIAGRYTNQRADVQVYKENPKEHNLSLIAAARYNHKKSIVLNISTRTDINTKENPKPQYSVGLKYGLVSNKLYLKANFSSQYRLPTFNDKYYVPGGNENILPEEAWNAETGLMFHALERQHLRLNFEATAYKSKVKNFISWEPVENQSHYAVSNIGKIRNKGWELMIYYQQRISNSLQLNANVSYNYVLSKNEITGKLMHYVPRHQMKILSKLRYKTFYLLANMNFRDKVTTSDFTDPIGRYSIYNLMVGNIFPINKLKFETRIKISNVFDKTYQNILNYPMPKSSYSITFTMNF